jgi:hypothetical protein
MLLVAYRLTVLFAVAYSNFPAQKIRTAISTTNIRRIPLLHPTFQITLGIREGFVSLERTVLGPGNLVPPPHTRLNSRNNNHVHFNPQLT